MPLPNVTVTKITTVVVPPYGQKSFAIGDIVTSDSPYYFPLINAGATNVVVTPPTTPGGGNVDLSNYFTKTEADARFVNESDYTPSVPGYVKPAGGIPASDLSAALQAALGGYDSATSTFNITEAGFRQWRQAVAKQRNGEGPAHIAWIGDSTTAGATLTVGQERVQSPPGRLVSVLGGKFGSGPVLDGFSTPVSYYNNGVFSRAGFTLGSGWAPYNDNSTPLVGIFYANPGAAGTLDYTPPSNASWDTAIVVFSTYQGFNCDLRVDAGAAVPFSAAGGTGLVTKKVTASSVGQHTLKIGNVSAGQIRVIAVVVYDSTQSQSGILVSNLGIVGMNSPSWDYQQPNVSTLDFLNAIKPDLTIVNLGINDAKQASNAHVSATDYMTHMQNISAAARSVKSDVLFIVPQACPTNVGPGDAFGDHAYLDTKLYEIAGLEPTGLFDLTKRWGSYATYTANGYGDYPHPNAKSYWDVAQGVADVLARTV